MFTRLTRLVPLMRAFADVPKPPKVEATKAPPKVEPQKSGNGLLFACLGAAAIGGGYYYWDCE